MYPAAFVLCFPMPKEQRICMLAGTPAPVGDGGRHGFGETDGAADICTAFALAAAAPASVHAVADRERVMKL
jgi:hypothetical protein